MLVVASLLLLLFFVFCPVCVSCRAAPSRPQQYMQITQQQQMCDALSVLSDTPPTHSRASKRFADQDKRAFLQSPSLARQVRLIETEVNEIAEG